MHHKCSPAGDGHHDLATLAPELVRTRGVESAELVRSRDNPKRSALRRARVDMDAHCKDSIEHLRRRLNIDGPLLLRPSGAVRAVNAAPYGNAEILMNRHQPVLLRSLVEECALRGNRVRRQHGAYGRMLPNLAGDFRAPGLPEQCSGSRARGLKCIEMSG